MMLPLRSILIGLFLLIVSLPATAFGLDIRFQADAEVRGEKVTLGEISRITPDSERARQLGELKLFKAPQPGRETTWRATDVKKRISNSHDESRSGSGGLQSTSVPKRYERSSRTTSAATKIIYRRPISVSKRFTWPNPSTCR
jgi:hypothetical protein